MWELCLGLSVASFVLILALALLTDHLKSKQGRRANVFVALFAAVLVAAYIMFIPIQHTQPDAVGLGAGHTALLSLFTAMQIFTIGTEYQVIKESMAACPVELAGLYQIWVSVLFVVAPMLTFGFVLSMFKNLFSSLRYWMSLRRDAYIFSELNSSSLALATDISKNNKGALLVFTDVYEPDDEESSELLEKAKNLRAICFQKDLLAVNLRSWHMPNRRLHIFTIGADEAENLDQSLRLIERYRNRADVDLYVFSVGVEGELLLNTIDKGKMRVRRINHVRSLVYRILYEEGTKLFESATEEENGQRDISALVIGMGQHGTEMVRSLIWFGQMEGYTLHVDALDRDPLAEDKFTALVPELMSDKYNGVLVDGEAQYTLKIHSGIDVQTNTFAQLVQKLNKTTYVLVALGDDRLNISTAVTLRMLFTRIGVHPVIQAIVYNTYQKKAMDGVCNFRNQPYDIDFIGDMESNYTEAVILDSELEEDALQRHLKWGKEEDFWKYEYNYRSSTASAIHFATRVKLGMPGAGKKEEELTQEERDLLEIVEHRRWNAYMRSEGYVFSGSTDKSSRNDLAKMHHDLVDFDRLSEEDKRKDSRVGSS